MNKLLASLTMRQRIAIVAVALAVAGSLYGLVHWRKEADFKPLFSGLAPEDAAAIVQKLKESGVEYRLSDSLPTGPGTVLVPSARLAELRLSLAAAGIPKTGRIGYELFDRNNLGASEFTEHVNYRRALEGELERSVMSLAEVEQARVHITFPKDSVYLDAQQPAKASVLVRLKPGAHLSQQNVQAINHLVASAVEGLAPEAVSVLDMNGNLLGRPRAPTNPDGSEPDAASLDYRHQVETDLLNKINSTLEPLLGAEKFRAGVSVDCDFSGGDQSEEIYDPARTVMLTSQRTEDTAGLASASGIPGTASNLPRPSSRPGGGSSRSSRVSENITYQSSRTVKKTHLPPGVIRKISVAVLVDQTLTWVPEKNGFRRVLTPPSPEKLKVIHDLVAGVTGFNADRGDQLVVETQPFENTLLLEPPPGTVSGPGSPGTRSPSQKLQLDRKTLLIAAGILAVLLALGIVVAMKLRRKKSKTAEVTGPAELNPPAPAESSVENQLASRLHEAEALKHEQEAKALNLLKLTPPITKAAEVLAKHLREKITQDPEINAQVLRAWIREEEA
ncbi:MAG TPA: flagellar basal-body MS-ring/collar protein FliF [Bryobacteraceae bacterium]|nr:flagellar basal-body MS-ring/collar protein FliF [Bryobacteraceae bacterium]